MYSKRAFVHWYVGEGMEEVCSQQCFHMHIKLIPCRVNFRKHVKILQPSSVTTRRSAQTRPMLRKKANIRRSTHRHLPRVAFFFFLFSSVTLYDFLNTVKEYPAVERLMSMLLVLRILTLGYS